MPDIEDCNSETQNELQNNSENVEQGRTASQSNEELPLTSEPSTIVSRFKRIPVRLILEILSIVAVWFFTAILDYYGPEVREFVFGRRAVNWKLTTSKHGVNLLDQTEDKIRTIYVQGDILHAHIFSGKEKEDDRILIGIGKGEPEIQGQCLIYDTNGKLLGQYNPFHERLETQTAMVNETGKIHPSSSSQYLHVIKLSEGKFFGRKYAVALSRDSFWSMSKIDIFDVEDQRRMYEFIHPGHLHDVIITDIDKSDNDELLVAGINNRISETVRLLGTSNGIEPLKKPCWIYYAMLLKPISEGSYHGFLTSFKHSSPANILWASFAHKLEKGVGIYWKKGAQNVVVDGRAGVLYSINLKGTEVVGHEADTWGEKNRELSHTPLFILNKSDGGYNLNIAGGDDNRLEVILQIPTLNKRDKEIIERLHKYLSQPQTREELFTSYEPASKAPS